MNIFDMFDEKKKIDTYLNENSSWTDISHYLMFLTLKNGGCSKSDSGSLRIHFPTHWDEKIEFTAEIGGNDIPNMHRHETISAETEMALKQTIVKKMEEAREMIVDDLKADEGN